MAYRPRLGIVLILSVLLLPTHPNMPAAEAFAPSVHESILVDALNDGDTLEWDALHLVIDANLLQDANQITAGLHFDSARNPSDICDRWRVGVQEPMERAVELSAPEGAEKRQLKDRAGALSAFGAATHAIHDFYAHSNWVDSMVAGLARGPVNLPRAPLHLGRCDPNTLPPDLQTGYFNVIYGVDGCPGTALGGAPNPGAVGFGLCHEQLAKDHPDSGHGAEVSPTGATYHDIARQTAVAATVDAWEALHDRIVDRYGPDSTIDAECLFTKLAWGGDRTCHRKWLATGTLRSRTPGLGETTAEGFETQLRWRPTRYPGPNAAPAFARLEGDWKHAGAARVQISGGNGDCEWRAVFNNQGPVEGRIKVAPEPQDPELLSLWSDPAAPAGALVCQTPTGPISQPAGPLSFAFAPPPFVLFFDPQTRGTCPPVSPPPQRPSLPPGQLYSIELLVGNQMLGPCLMAGRVEIRMELQVRLDT